MEAVGVSMPARPPEIKQQSSHTLGFGADDFTFTQIMLNFRKIYIGRIQTSREPLPAKRSSSTGVTRF